jgi:peptidoglycan glycosyltransferase
VKHGVFKSNRKAVSRLLLSLTIALIAPRISLASPGHLVTSASSSLSLEQVNFEINAYGDLFLDQLPRLVTRYGSSLAGRGETGERIEFSADPKLQDFTAKLIATIRAPHVAAVVMEPETGKILAMAGKSVSLKNSLTHAHFPAASLFKIVTSASALENGQVSPYTVINFRGGDYTLNQSNYFPDSKRDVRRMALAEALGKSCNPVFARVGLRYSSSYLLRKYSKLFGFNSDLGFDVPLLDSMASIPDDSYELSRTAAGFGAVKISPIHAAALMSTIANGGYLVKPHLVERVLSTDGEVLYEAPHRELLGRAIRPETAKALMEMLHSTTTVGTSRRDFAGNHWLKQIGVNVAAKTGTLSGPNPKGLNRWFIAAAPIEKPEVAVAVLVVNPGNYLASPSRIGRQLIEQRLKSK